MIELTISKILEGEYGTCQRVDLMKTDQSLYMGKDVLFSIFFIVLIVPTFYNLSLEISGMPTFLTKQLLHLYANPISPRTHGKKCLEICQYFL